MDAKTFLRERKRMCDSTPCGMCIMMETGCETIDMTEEEINAYVDLVEKWSKEHPKITNAMKFKEVFGFNIKRSTPSGEYLYMPENWLDQEYKPQEKNTDE